MYRSPVRRLTHSRKRCSSRTGDLARSRPESGEDSTFDQDPPRAPPPILCSSKFMHLSRRLPAMPHYLCHEQPDLLEFETSVVDARPGAVLLARSALHPGGGGQVCDTATLKHAHGVAQIIGISPEGGRYWHVLDTPLELAGEVHVSIDAQRRSTLAQLHTATHILNALVYQYFAGALVTGAQINADGSARMDFDLPDADNDALRALEGPLNDVVRQSLDVRASYIGLREAQATPGLIRSLSVAPPPTPDGTIRIVEIDGLDRQACGGTHLTNTAQSRPLRMTKIENKGHRNRRVRIELM
jgi:misacylated tRNA(Ala) deacylase